MTKKTERDVDCFSQGVKAIIDELRAEAIQQVPMVFTTETEYDTPNGEHHVQHDQFELREGMVHPNPNVHSICYNDVSKKLILAVEAQSERITDRRQNGLNIWGTSFECKVEKDCNLVQVKKIPTGFKVLGLHSGSILVTREEYRQISKSLREGKRCRDLAEEYDREYLADLKRGPLTASDY